LQRFTLNRSNLIINVISILSRSGSFLAFDHEPIPASVVSSNDHVQETFWNVRLNPRKFETCPPALSVNNWRMSV
jgi:hypothetical protein